MAECRPKNYPKLKDYKPSRFMLPTCHYDATARTACLPICLWYDAGFQ